MKHIHWLLPGQNHNIQSIQNNILASVRLRAYVSSINTKSFTFSFGENMPQKTDDLVIGKIGNFDLARRAKNWLNQIQMSNFSNNKLYFPIGNLKQLVFPMFFPICVQFSITQ